jgi:hypothetical protein
MEIEEREAELQLARADAARANERLKMLISHSETDSVERLEVAELEVPQSPEPLQQLQPEPFRPTVPDYSAVSIPPPRKPGETGKRGLLSGRR